MTNANAIIIGFSLVASSILLTGNIEPAHAFGTGKFTISSDTNGLAWVLNTDNGELTLCKPTSLSTYIRFICEKEFKVKETK